MSYSLNSFNPVLDGQWQGTFFASDGNVYFFSSSHTYGHGAAFFRYNTENQSITQLAADMSRTLGEDPVALPPQGKIHSDIVEYNGWIYFGTHLSIYTQDTRRRYTGGHLVGYNISNGAFRDFGVLRANHSIYSGLALDKSRGKIYVFTTPSVGNEYFYDYEETTAPGDGPRLFRVDIATGQKEDLGVLGQGGDACFHIFVDFQGDAWLVPQSNLALNHANAVTGRIERFSMPASRSWYWAGPHPDGRRAVVFTGDRFGQKVVSIFDPAGRTYQDIQTVSGTLSVTIDSNRVYYLDYDSTGASTKLGSVSLDPASLGSHTFHGNIIDQEGRKPQRLTGIATDGRGRIFVVGDWFKLPGETGSIRNGQERSTVHRFGVIRLR